jgi:hypothetical protein
VTHAPHAPHDAAIVIGINDYPMWGANGRPLKGAVSDARAFDKWLRDPKGGGLTDPQIALVSSELDPLKPLKQHVEEGLDRVLKHFPDGARRRRFYFFFSGHGHTRLATRDDKPSLCLAPWSLRKPNAALDVASYERTISGCLKFEEAFFFLDCCRVKQSAPAGQSSEYECGSPDTAGRRSFIAYGADVFAQGFEGENKDDDIRGYFSDALVTSLTGEGIALIDLMGELEATVPVLSSNKQKARFQQNLSLAELKQTWFGPPRVLPRRPHPPLPDLATPDPPPSAPPDRSHSRSIEIVVRSNLGKGADSGIGSFHSFGDISLLTTERRVVKTAIGKLSASVADGGYILRIAHAEAVTEKQIEVGPQSHKFNEDLPHRRSAAPFSSTFGKRELTTKAIIRSTQADAEGQSLYIAARTKEGQPYRRPTVLKPSAIGPAHLDIPLIREVGVTYRASPGSYLLAPESCGEIQRTCLPVPVAAGWDTLVFVTIDDDDRPILDRATVMMRRAGSGFDPRDELNDAYERAAVDLFTGGPGPSRTTMRQLLRGKFRNPLFGLVGAHFLIRAMGPRPASADRALLREVVANLSTLLGQRDADLFALKMIAAEHLDLDGRSPGPGAPPLLRISADILLRGTAREPDLLKNVDAARSMALGRIAESPWNCWIEDGSQALGGYMMNDTGHPRKFMFRPLSTQQRDRAVDLLSARSMEVLYTQIGQETFELQASGKGGVISRELFSDFPAISRAVCLPDWVVDFVRAESKRAWKRGQTLDLGKLTERTLIPRDLLEEAQRVAAPRLAHLVRAVKPIQFDAEIEAFSAAAAADDGSIKEE